jgi:DNA-binding transcriptional LysR family regulator
LEIANTQTIQRHLLAGTVELGFTEGLVEAGHLDFKIFAEDELVAIAPRGHPFLQKRRVSVRDLCRAPFVMREEGSGTRAVVEQALRRRGQSVRSVLSLAGTEAVKHAVIAGIGLAIISRLALSCELQAGSLAVIPISDLDIRRPLHLQTLQGRALGPAAARFLEILASQKPPGTK